MVTPIGGSPYYPQYSNRTNPTKNWMNQIGEIILKLEEGRSWPQSLIPAMKKVVQEMENYRPQNPNITAALNHIHTVFNGTAWTSNDPINALRSAVYLLEDPGNKWLSLIQTIKELISHGKISEALDALGPFISEIRFIDPRPDALYNQLKEAESLLQNGNSSGAIAALEGAAKAIPQIY